MKANSLVGGASKPKDDKDDKKKEEKGKEGKEDKNLIKKKPKK